jgi:hypothetical protein
LNMRILLIGNHHSVFPSEITKKLRKSGIEVAHVDFRTLQIETGEDAVETRYAERLKKMMLPKRLHSLARLYLLAKILGYKQDEVVHFHYARWFYFLLVPILRRTEKSVAVTVYGSDFYRIAPWQRRLQRLFFHAVEAISFTNEGTMASLLAADASLQKKCFITRFGLSPLDVIDRCRGTAKAVMREALGVPEYPVTVACGYNANPGQQHLKIIEALQRLPAGIREKTLFLFPLMYSGTEEYRLKVRNALESSGLHWHILDTFLEGKKNAYVRLLPDVMINMLMSDQLSGSMQEHLYAGNVVIAGAWLPYEIFIERGVYMEQVDSFNALPEAIDSTIENLSDAHRKTSHNRKVIRALSGWEAAMPGWQQLYEFVTRVNR